MARFLKSRQKAKGAAPGSLIFIGQKKMENSLIRSIEYDNDNLLEKNHNSIEEALSTIKTDSITWLNIDGIHDTNLVQSVGKHFGISPLALENILNTGSRAKVFEDTQAITVITKAIYYNNEEKSISVEQISFLLLKNVLISFQEKQGDHFEPVRERIRNKTGRIRKAGSDYLLYTLIDSLVDNYLINIELIGTEIENIENKLSLPDRNISTQIYHFKTETAYFRKTIRPLKEVMIRLLRTKSDLINADSQVFFQELFELVEQSQEAVETYFSMSNDHLNMYNTNVSNRVNEVMKVLTIFASIFIPLTFIAGIYGTNFEYLPELSFRYSYFVMWGVMLLVVIVMLSYFKRNKWF